ncbi:MULTISPECIES: hypothetical protein [unclassified Modestobacter]
MPRLSAPEVAAWLLKSSRPADAVAPDWTPGAPVTVDRCVRRSYRLSLLRPGQPCVLWISGRDHPGVHALGTVAGHPVEDPERGPVVRVRWRRLTEPVDRAELVADPAFAAAEVVRMPAGSNPSWLSADQYAAVLARVAPRDGPD